MSFFSFITTSNPEWDKKIACGIRTECGGLPGIKADFQTQSFYVKSGETFAGGISMEQHGDILWIDPLYFLDPDGHKLEIHVGDWQARIQAKKMNLGSWKDVEWFV